nr:MAG TPA: hypothetical protein [Caudoviricetes sp.]
MSWKILTAHGVIFICKCIISHYGYGTILIAHLSRLGNLTSARKEVPSHDTLLCNLYLCAQ